MPIATATSAEITELTGRARRIVRSMKPGHDRLHATVTIDTLLAQVGMPSLEPYLVQLRLMTVE